MFAKLTGVLDTVQEDSIILDVSGVGYLVFCSGRTLSNLPAVGQTISLMIETQVREDQISLYGFPAMVERDWFRLLLSVQGVGSRVALAILTALPPDQLMVTLGAKDKTALTRADGVGPKLAARLVTELSDKVGSLSFAQTSAVTSTTPASGGGATAPVAEIPTNEGDIEDAVSALVHLGYGRSEAFRAVSTIKARLGEEANLDNIIKESLLELSA